MKLDSDLYLHDSDKAAMTALKGIPGFTQVMKGFMKIWNEQQFKLINMSTNLRISEEQMPQYYNMLLPICEKLGIEVPELYLEMNVVPNAYTYGDTHPFIVITSGLLDIMPDELIPTILAHECGHIACHHTLYTTMGKIIMNGSAALASGLSGIISYPLQLAFSYWSRCSEFSADRAAMIYDGGSDKVVEMCMRFAGYDKNIQAKANPEAFMQQAVEYRKLVKESTWNKTMEFMLFQNINHPLNAVRALEAKEWTEAERFNMINEYLNSSSEEASKNMPIKLNPKNFIGKDYYGVANKLKVMGFAYITTVRTTVSPATRKKGEVVQSVVNGVINPGEDFYKKDSIIELTYFEPKTDEEIALEHPGEIRVTENYKFYLGKPISEVIDDFKKMGFNGLHVKEMALPKLMKWGRENTVAKIIINNDSQFEAKTWYKPDVEIIVYYYVIVE